MSINSAEVAHHRDSKNMANSNDFNVSFHIDNFLFSDDDDNQEARPITAVAGGPPDDIVPDSSDEASTGPALDMDLESADEDGLKHIVQSTTIDQDSYAHANASSGTRQAFKTSHYQYQEDPITVNPRELAVVPTTFTTSKTPESRDSDAPGSVHYNTSIATTEVIPTQREDTSSLKTVSPGDRPPHMLGRESLQPRQAQSAAEAVKSRQRPKAKPLVLASKDVKAAVRGRSPPRKPSNESSSLTRPKNKGKQTDQDDDDDELRLKSSKSKQSKGGGIEAATTRDNRTSSTGVIELESDGDVPLTKASTSKSKTAESKSKKGKQRAAFQDIDSDDSEVEQAKEAADDELMQEILKANTKESDDDDDYDGKSTSKDKWNRKGKKKNARRSSKTPSEEPAAKVSARPSRAKGRPCPSSKKGTGRLSIADSDDPQSDEAIVLGARTASKAGKNGTAAEEKARSSKGPQPRSKEFLDDEDMEDDVPAASPQDAIKSARNTAKDTSSASAKEQAQETSEAETAPLPPSSDAPIAARSKPTKTYGKKGRKSVCRVQESEDDEGPAERSSVLLSDKTAKALSSFAVEKAVGGQKERSSSGEAMSSRSKRSVSPACAVIIDNSAKKNRTPTSRSSRDTNSKSRIADTAEPQHSDPEGATSASSKSGTAQTIKKKGTFKTKSTLRIVDSEEDDEAEAAEEEEAKDEDERTSKRPQDEKISTATLAGQALLSTSTTSTGKVESARSVLQTKNANIASPTKASAKLAKAEGSVATPSSFLKGKANSIDIKPVIGSTGKRFHDMVVAKGGGQGIRAQGLSKRSKIPTLLSFRAPPPPKKPPLPQAPVKKKKKGEEVYSDEDQEELNDQPEEWWDRDDFYEWEKRKRKRAKAKGEIDSDDERELAQQQKKMKKETSSVVLDATTVAEVEHFSD